MALLKSVKTSRNDDKNALKKARTNTTVQRSAKAGGVGTRIQQAVALVEKKLGAYKDDYILIRDEETLANYMQKCNDNIYSAIDTETTSLNVFEAKIAGVCLYSEGLQAAYIPINHRSYVTMERTSNQLTEEQVAKYLDNPNIRWIMHNADYDIRILRHCLGIRVKCYWDTMLAGNCIDENESHRLKDLHLKYCPSEHETESLSFDTLFNGIDFTLVPISTAYLYAAGDAIKTFELYEYQLEVLKTMPEVLDLLLNIEMPVVEVVADMEDRGVCIDFDYAEELSTKYNKKHDEILKKANDAISMYSEEIENYMMRNPNSKISMPLNLNSPTQLAILFYDILKLESPLKKSPRGTGEEILQHFAKGKHKDICNAILELRGVEKLLSTYIDKIPELAKTYPDKRVHCGFRQWGAKTGRFSSNDPNLQNIPSHNRDIRPMFSAQEGYLLVGGDYSAQEPRLTAHMSGDEKMIQAYKDGKDVYVEIASIAFNKPYDECKEFRADGTLNIEGKERRNAAKAIVLGINYGKGVPAIGEDLGISTEKAQQIYDNVLKAFPRLKDFMHDSQENCRTLGYVSTAWGRRRHLPDMQLEKYEFSLIDGTPVDFDPLAFGTQTLSFEVPEKTKREFTKRLDEAWGFKKKNEIKEEAISRGIKIKDNQGFIAQAERQCVNSIIQGSAADLTKKAMILIHNDEKMKELGFHLLIPVHDELIGEVPRENAKEASERLSYLMCKAAENDICVPMKVDCELTEHWYGEEIEVE